MPISWDAAPTPKSGGITWESSSPAKSGDSDIQARARRIAQEEGINPDTFFRLVKQESSWNPRARSGAGAMGLTQLMPDTAKGLGVTNPWDPEQNLRGGARYFKKMMERYNNDERLAAAAYNAGPGRVDEHLSRNIPLPQETVQYISIVTPHQNATAPRGVSWESPAQSPQRNTGNETGNAARDAITHKAKPVTKHSFLQEAGGAMELPFLLPLAQERGKTKEALAQYLHDPAAAAEHFGFGSKEQLEWEAKNAKEPTARKFAQFMLDHPTLAGLTTFGAEMFNPGGVAVGGAIGRGGAAAHAALSQTPNGRYFLNLLSPFKGVAAAAGDTAVHKIMAGASNIQHRTADAERVVERIFGGLTKNDKIEVVRASQGLEPEISRKPELLHRAQDLRKVIQTTTAEQRTVPGILPHVFDPDIYFPMARSYTHPMYDPADYDIVEALRGGGTSEAGMMTRVPYGEKVHATIDEAIASGKLKPDFDPAVNLRQYLAGRGRNIEFEQMLRSLPDTLIKPITRENIRTVPHDESGIPFVKGKDVFSNLQSPTLKKSWMHPALAEWMKTHGGSMLAGQATRMGGIAGSALNALDHFNNAMRQAIISNPLFHPVWNLRENAAAAGKMPIEAVRQTFKTIVGALPRGDQMYKNLWPQTQEQARAVAAATKAGASAEMAATRSVLGKDIAHVRTTPWSELSTPKEYIDKILTDLTSWNRRVVFGETGEKAFAATLFTRLQQLYPHAAPEDVGYMVREALGNYQNVDPNSWQSRLFFFYPWLKGNTAFWFKQMATNPNYVNAPARGIREHNELAQDPNYGGNFPTRDFSLYKGTPNGSPAYMTLPLPQRTAVDITNALASREPKEMGFAGESIMRSHATPLVGETMDAMTTIAQRQARDPAVGSNYNIIFDADAPESVQWKQIGAYLLSHNLPLPLIQYAVQDAARRGLHPADLAGEIEQTLGVGFSHERASMSQSKHVSKARNLFERKVRAAHKAAENGVITQEQANARIKRAYDAYSKHRDKAEGSQP